MATDLLLLEQRSTLLAERKVDPDELHRCMNRICVRGPSSP
jgi:hypothetical protein